MSDADRIAEIRERAQAATRGPWRWGWRNDPDVPGSITAGHPTRPEAVAMCPRYGASRFPDDAEFIAHAREDVPWLLDRLTEAESRAERAERQLAEMAPLRPDQCVRCGRSTPRAPADLCDACEDECFAESG